MFPKFPEEDKHQHFLQNLDPYKNLIDSLDISGRIILEIGVGHGEITKLLLEQGANVIGYEIDKNIGFQHPNLTMIYKDFRYADIDDLKDLDLAIIANPPYNLIPDIMYIARKLSVWDNILMIPESEIQNFANFKIEIVYQSSDFKPESSGKHYVVRRGFYKGRKKNGDC